jgi:hypothetical protein
VEILVKLDAFEFLSFQCTCVMTDDSYIQIFYIVTYGFIISKSFWHTISVVSF